VYKTAQRFAWNPSTFKAYDLINRGIYFVIASPKPYESFDDFMARLKEAEQRGVDP
jgi:hypothetical protein